MIIERMVKVGVLVLLIIAIASVPAVAKSNLINGYQEINATKLKTIMDESDPLVVFPLSSIEFNDLHIAGSVNIPLHALNEQLPTDKERTLVFYCLGMKCTASWRAAEKAVKFGYSNVFAFRAGLPAWVAAGYPTVSTVKLPKVDVEKISTDKLYGMVEGDDDIVVLDVCLKRDAEKFWIDSPKRIHIPLDELEARINEIPKDKKIAVICLKGKRSPTAIRYLTAKGFTDLLSIKGGMQQWILEGKPVKTKSS
ncbi:MAG: hypothetical protein C0623_09435 [Desulfuromonas sp.]|nr:MAG: hypothetical protein C0623_09435 [Desulfuromonas sp.]